MTTTPNYGFTIAEGTDTVNLLTQSYPNFTNLDSILKTIEDTGITTAVATKVGTVFQIVRTNTDLAVMRFVATANYAAGDTFTVDGVSVTATAMNGTALPAGAFVINQSVEAILNGSVLTIVGVSGATSVAAQDVTYDNTVSGLTATDVQNAIDEVVSDIPAGFAATAITYDNSASGLTATEVQAAIDELAIPTNKPWTLIDTKTGTTPINCSFADYTEFRITMDCENQMASTDIFTDAFTPGVTNYLRVGGGFSSATYGTNFTATITNTNVALQAATLNTQDKSATARIRLYAR